MIEEPLYRSIVKVLPIVCVDVIIRVRGRGYLLVRRTQEPLKGEWWIPGGRILHQETASDAAVRKLRTEVGVDATAGDLRFVGYYEDVFEVSSLGDGPYHTVSLVYEIELAHAPAVALDSTSAGWRLAAELPKRLKVHTSRDAGPIP